MSKTKVTLPAAEITDKWARRLKGAVADIQRGIDAVTESPMEKAAAKQDKMLANITAAVQDGRWAAGLRSVNVQDWKSKTKQKVGERLAGGVEAARSKHQQFTQWQVNTLNTILPRIAAMPDLTLEDSIARTAEFIRQMSSNKYKS